MLCNFISLLPLPLAPGGVFSAQPNSWPKAGLPQFPSWKESPSCNQPTPSPSLPVGALENGSSPYTPTPILRPQTEAISGVDRPFQMGEKRVCVSNWTPGRKWGAREGGSEGQEHRPGAQEDQEPRGKNPFKMSHMCKHGGLPGHPDPLASLPSATHLSGLSSVPWELMGSLSLDEFQAHLAWAFPDDRGRGTSF